MTGGNFQTFDNGLPVFQLPRDFLLAELLRGFQKLTDIIGNHKAPNGKALHARAPKA
jgi:hypothetical protein